jgi:predicted GNAT family acetyltransferase
MLYAGKTWHYHTLIRYQDENLMNVRDNRSASRFELDTDAGMAFINYRRDHGTLVMTHAEVPSVLNGRGIGSQLVKGALEQVRINGEKVVPQCPFVAVYIKRHPEFQSLLLPYQD